MGSESREAREAYIRSRLRAIHVEKLRAAQAEVTQAAADMRNVDGRVGRTGRMRMQVPMQAVANAVFSEGKAVLRDETYWADMRRRHPEIAIGRDVGVVKGLRNRFGRVKERIRFVGGRKVVETAAGIEVI